MTPNEPRDTVPADPPVVEPVEAPVNPPAFLPAYLAELAEVLRRDLHAEHPLLTIAGSASGPQAVAVLVALGGTREVYTAEDGSRFVRAVVRFGDLEISAQHVQRAPMRAAPGVYATPTWPCAAEVQA
jgi:hypothetical protein